MKLQNSSPPPSTKKKKAIKNAKLLLSISCKTKVFRVLSTWRFGGPTPSAEDSGPRRRLGNNAPHDWWAYVVSKGVSPWLFIGGIPILFGQQRLSRRQNRKLVWKCWKFWKANRISVGSLNDWVTWVNTPLSGIYSQPLGLHQGGMEGRFQWAHLPQCLTWDFKLQSKKQNFNLSKCLLGVLPAAIINSVQWTENGHLSPFASWCNTLCRRLLWRWLLIYIPPGNTGSTSDSSAETLKSLVQLLYLHEDCELAWACCERHKSHWDHVELNCLWSATSDTDTLSSWHKFASVLSAALHSLY